MCFSRRWRAGCRSFRRVSAATSRWCARPELGDLVEFGDARAFARARAGARREWDRAAIIRYARSNTWDRHIDVLEREFRALVNRSRQPVAAEAPA